MKKIALCSLLVTAFVGTASASIIKDADCKTEFRPENNNWMARSNEYLFPTEQDYLNVVNRGKVYECDNEYCGHNTYVSLPAGHFFNGNYKSQPATYKCVLGKALGVEWLGDDKWEKVDSTSGLTKCTKTHDKWGKTGSDSDEYLYPTKSDYDAVNKDNYGLVFECDSNSKYCHEGTTVTLGGTHYHGKTKVTGTKTYACVTRGGGDYWMEITDDCEDCKKPDPKPDPKPGSCSQFKAYPERYACCIMGSATTWTGPASSGTCTCVDKTKEWKYANGTGVCQAKDGGDDGNGGGDTTPETTKQCWYSFSADVRCANGASISKASGFYVDTKAATCEEFTRLYKDDKAFMMEMAEKYCSQHPELPVVDDKAFNAAKDSINAFFNNAKSDASVWKNAEGKFNTARLASDLTAGVVLGTVGGVVSGVVIKKKQVEKGFDALHCTVGGQKVADWGDEFNIGLRK